MEASAHIGDLEVSPLVVALADLDARPRGLTFEGEAWSGARLERLARAYAAGLVAALGEGLRVGERVAVSAEGTPLQVAAVLAHLRLGLVHVPLNPRYTDDEVAYVVGDAGALRHLREPELETLAAAGAAHAEAFTWPTPPAPSALALLVYTSGTTGRPKGVMLSHRALASNLSAVTGLWRFSPADALVLALPLFHVHGLGLGVLGGLMRGVELRLLRRFEAAAVIAELGAGATMFMGVPTMYHLLLEHLENHPEDAAALARARLFTAGSAALSEAAFRAFEAKTGHAILERYGMTETGFTLSNPYEGERRPGSVGRVVPGVELRLVDEAGEAVEDGVPGEIEVRGDNLMDGYWGRPEATAAAFREGWFRTGDTAVREGGYVRIVGRTSTDIIKSGGFKIGAREIEDALMATGLLTEVAVLGVPDPKWGEVVAAVLVPRAPDEPGLEDALDAHARAVLVDYKRPRRYARVEALPRNALGKVQKAPLRALFEGPTG